MLRNAFYREAHRDRLSYFNIIFLISTILFLPAVTSAQTEEEVKMLRMYFNEDELVLSPTRTLKPISKVAENISIITAEEIEAMNVHTVIEVLERVPGVFIDPHTYDFGSVGDIYMQGSDTRHVLVLLDGLPWNFTGGGNAVTQTIPIRIIKRIEIIKGPASSSWGSALGGVINIITKETKDTEGISGTINASVGERDTHDLSAEATGKSGIGYYLYAGRQDSDGLRESRFFKNNSFYGKIDIPLPSDVKLSLTTGYSEPRNNTGDLPSIDLSTGFSSRVFFMTSSLTAGFTDNLSFEASLYTLKRKSIIDTNILGTGAWDPNEKPGDLFEQDVFEEKNEGGSGKLIWMQDMHTAVVGIDVSHGQLDNSIETGEIMQTLFGSPEKVENEPGISKWAVFANDTISIKNFSITPGIRYDKNNLSGDFTSPSLGATYKLDSRTVLRASVAKGFTTPSLSWISGGGLFLDPNPDLKPENVWSYHAGIESTIQDYVRAKATVFYHEMKNEMVFELNPDTGNDIFVNKGKIKRNGMELFLETIPFYNVSGKAGFAYVRRTDIQEETYNEKYSYNLTARYDDRKSLSAQLDGRYIWWDRDYTGTKYNTFIWDLNLSKKFQTIEKIKPEIFLVAHNIFNGTRYTLEDRKNPRRWIETGLRLSF